MSDMANNQSFGVDDIRRIREENEKRYREQEMTTKEILQDIHERAQEGWKLLEQFKRERSQLKASG